MPGRHPKRHPFTPVPPPGRAAPWLRGGTAPSWTPANSFGRRPKWKSLTQSKTTSRPLEHQRGNPGALAQRGDRAQVPEALRPGALPAGRHRGLRGVVPGDIDEDRHGAGQCRRKCSHLSVDFDKYRRFATWQHRRPSGRARFPANRKSAVRKRGPVATTCPRTGRFPDTARARRTT